MKKKHFHAKTLELDYWRRTRNWDKNEKAGGNTCTENGNIGGLLNEALWFAFYICFVSHGRNSIHNNWYFLRYTKSEINFFFLVHNEFSFLFQCLRWVSHILVSKIVRPFFNGFLFYFQIWYVVWKKRKYHEFSHLINHTRTTISLQWMNFI